MVRRVVEFGGTIHSGVGEERRLRRILIVTELSSPHGRGVLRGVNRFARPSRPWVFLTCPPWLPTLDAALTWRPDGVIAQAFTQPVAGRLRQLSVPVVTVSNTIGGLPLPKVTNDDQAIGRLAARYLLDRGFRHFGFVGPRSAVFSRTRGALFAQTAREAGFNCRLLLSDRYEASPALFEQVLGRIGRWLRALSKPVAVFAATDNHGLLVTQACHAAGLAVPEQVAVLGVDDDELTCQWSHPPLSSVRTATRVIGFEAAGLLERLMEGQRPPAAPGLVAPIAVITRQSTDVLAIEDAHLAQAVRYIATHVARRINAGDVATAINLSRRSLERRFRDLLGRSILDEIHRVRVAVAQQMLVDTHRPVPEVAVSCGFRDAQHFWDVFRRRTGEAPADFRRRGQIGATQA